MGCLQPRPQDVYRPVFFFQLLPKIFFNFYFDDILFFPIFPPDFFFNYLLFWDVFNPARKTSIGLAELAAGVERLGLLLHLPSAAGSRALIEP